MDNTQDRGQNAKGRKTEKTGGKPDKRRFRDTSRRLRESGRGQLQNRAGLEFRLDKKTVATAKKDATTTIDVAALTDIIRQSRTGETLLTAAETAKTKIVYDAQTVTSQFYTRDTGNIITLNPHRPTGEMVSTLVRELRRAWLQEEGVLLNPLSFEPDEAILLNRAQQADTFMIAVKVAWELKLAGLTEPWEYLAGSPVADITRSFEIKAQTDFRTLNNGEAARAAYDKFFEDGRVRSHDKRIIHQMLLDDAGYIKSTRKIPQISPDTFRKMGELPHGKNYFSAKSRHLPNDPVYTAIEDRSNANFLWFIKFERSFQEKERQMMEDSVKLSAEIVDFAKWSLSAGKPATH